MTKTRTSNAHSAVYGDKNMEDFLHRLTLAGRALKHLPKEQVPRGNRAWWPDVVNKAQEAYGYQEARVTKRRPTIDEMTALEWLLDAIWQLDAQKRSIVLARVQGMSWRQIGKHARRNGHYPNSHESCRRVYRAAVDELANA